MPEIIKQVDALIAAERLADAQSICVSLSETHPHLIDTWLLVCKVAQRQLEIEVLLMAADRALAIKEDSVVALLYKSEGLILAGQIDKANVVLERLEEQAISKSDLLQNIAVSYTNSSQHEAAERCYRRALQLQPSDSGIIYNLASATIATGKLEEADALYTQLLEVKPNDYDAYYNRSTLRKQTRTCNHVSELKKVFERVEGTPVATPIGFALSKELEDLGENGKAFSFLKAGADQRRKGLAYKVADDTETIEHIKTAFDDEFFAKQVSEEAASPIFILGLPRSGTTLVDRILSSHSDAASLGEINDLVLSVMRVAGQTSGKSELIKRTAQMDLAALGVSYAKSLKNHRRNELYLIDKTPMNYLYLGLIVKALPNAKIIHMNRNPMDSCYAMYKTLFRMGYPFSYDLSDLGAYYVAYHGLMTHWRNHARESIFDVSYENLIANQETVSRKMVNFCGLEWQDACLDFHKNTSAAATASAAQVREPIYSSSVGLWKKYEKELEPIQRYLEENGIETQMQRDAG